jgi:hypothetical protein
MAQFRTIDIDFDVHKLIEGERTSFSETPNDVLRRLLQLGQPAKTQSLTGAQSPAGRSWSDEGVILPHGTSLKMNYNGRTHSGQIVDGKWLVEGNVFSSPSGAASAVAITRKGKKTKLDGWIYWMVARPGDSTMVRLDSLRSMISTAKDQGL